MSKDDLREEIESDEYRDLCALIAMHAIIVNEGAEGSNFVDRSFIYANAMVARRNRIYNEVKPPQE